MKRITNINQLKPGDKIFIVNQDGSLEILEFREIHPNNDNYSLFLNENQDGMHKLARTFAKMACLCYEACERDFEEEKI